MKTKSLATIAIISALTAASAHAAVLSIDDYTLVPDGTQFGSNNPTYPSNAPAGQEAQITDLRPLNGNAVVLPASATQTVYMVTTFTFGETTAADFYLNFAHINGADRLGINISNAGIANIIGGGTSPSVDLAPGPLTMAGQTVTLLFEYLYDVNRNASADDTLLNVWINPTGSTLPSGGLAAGDLNRVWNSAGFAYLEQRIDNNATPGTAGSSSILNTTILTGTDATFSNALALATIPEPSAALLGALGFLALLRRRR